MHPVIPVQPPQSLSSAAFNGKLCSLPSLHPGVLRRPLDHSSYSLSPSRWHLQELAHAPGRLFPSSSLRCSWDCWQTELEPLGNGKGWARKNGTYQQVHYKSKQVSLSLEYITWAPAQERFQAWDFTCSVKRRSWCSSDCLSRLWIPILSAQALGFCVFYFMDFAAQTLLSHIWSTHHAKMFTFHHLWSMKSRALCTRPPILSPKPLK